MATSVKPVKLNLDRLETMAESDYYNPYTIFDWPDSLDESVPWMSESLVTLAGTEEWDALTREQQLALTRHEAVNFFSLNVHGIRELLSDVVLRIHTKTYADASEFLHHFIGEENEHMWFFGTFCLKYGGKVYPPVPQVGMKALEGVGDAASELIIFARILIFEELVDHFNALMATDQSLPQIAREINRVHHQDESRHVAFGRHLFAELLEQVRETRPEDIPVLAKYLDAYLEYSVRSLYNPAVYRDAGIPEPLELRRRLLEHPARHAAHERILNRTRKFLARNGLEIQETAE